MGPPGGLIGTVTLQNLPLVPVLAVTSHNNSARTTAVFENVDVRNHIGP